MSHTVVQIEQPLSLRQWVEICGICRGDTALVEFATGVVPEGRDTLSLSFCSAYMRRIGDLRQKGWPWQRGRGLPPEVVLMNGDEIRDFIPFQRGMVYAKAIVQCRPAITLRILPASIEFFAAYSLPIAACAAEEPEGLVAIYPHDPELRYLSTNEGTPIARTIVCDVMPYMVTTADDDQAIVLPSPAHNTDLGINLQSKGEHGFSLEDDPSP